MAAKKKTAKKKTGKALATGWQGQLAKHAKGGKAPKEKPVTGDYISSKGSKFSLGGVILGRVIDATIVAWNFEKSRYDSDFVEGEASCPVCFAIGYDEDELAPHKDSPVPQNDACDGCELNEWGSADKGEGKACSDRRRLALVVEHDGKAELKSLNIAPTSLKNWKSFLHEVESMGLHTLQCRIRIGFDEDSTAVSPPLTFDFLSEITAEKTLNVLAGTLEAAEKMIETTYDPKNYTAPKGKGKKKGKKKAGKKKVSKKKGRSKFSR